MFRKPDDIYNENFQIKPMTRSEYGSILTIGSNRLPVADFMSIKSDWRSDDVEHFVDVVYDLYHVNHKAIMGDYIRQKTNVTDDMIRFKPSALHEMMINTRPSVDTDGNDTIDILPVYDKSQIKDGTRILGRTGRRNLNNNIFFEHIFHHTKKSANGGTAKTVVDKMFCAGNGHLDSANAAPSVLKSWVESKNAENLIHHLNTGSQKASVFNPRAYAFILDLLGAKKILTPVGSWASPVIALHNSSVEELVLIDVIPDVIEKCDRLHEYFSSGSMPSGINIFPDMLDDKKFKSYCCPSQHIDKRLGFGDTYKEHFDTVFFSPAYFDVECYEGGEQSWEEYPTYDEWMNGYWRGTVEMCKKVLEKGGTFSFVIVPYYIDKKGNRIDIGTDMLNVAKEYFDHDMTLDLYWGNTGQLHDKAEMSEFVHILRNNK